MCIRAQSSLNPLVVTGNTVSNAWMTYTYPQSYHDLKNQADKYIETFRELGELVEVVDSMGACSAYRSWMPVDTYEGDVQLNEIFANHTQTCAQSGKTNLAPEFAMIQRQIVNYSSLITTNFKDLMDGKDDRNDAAPPIALAPSFHKVRLENQLLYDAGNQDMDAVIKNLFYYESNYHPIHRIMGRRLAYTYTSSEDNRYEKPFDQDDFGSHLRDNPYGAHIYCYLFPGKGNAKEPCDYDTDGYFVKPSDTKEPGDYFDNMDSFLTYLASDYRIRNLDCLRQEKNIEDPIGPGKIAEREARKSKIKTRITKCLAGAFADMSLEKQRNSKARLVKGTLRYPVSDCVRFYATNRKIWWFLGDTLRYLSSFIVGVGPKVGKMEPICKMKLIQEEFWKTGNGLAGPVKSYKHYIGCDANTFSRNMVLELNPESNQDCEDYRKRLKQLEADMARAKDALEKEREAVRQGLKAYQQQYQELERKQQELVKAYANGAKSIADILEELADIKERVSSFDKGLKEKKEAIEAQLKAAEERAERERKRLAANKVLTAKLESCQALNLDMQQLQQTYSKEVNEAFEAIKADLQRIMEENTQISQAIQNQQKVPTWDYSNQKKVPDWDSPITKMDSERYEDSTLQKMLKQQYVNGQEETLAILLNTSMPSEERNKKLSVLQATDQEIYDSVNEINVRSERRREDIGSLKTKTQATLNEIEEENTKLKQQLVAINQKLEQVNKEITSRQNAIKAKEQVLNQKGNAVTVCFNEAIAMQKENEALSNQTLTDELQEAARLREELKKLDEEEKGKDAFKTQEALERERKRLLDEITRLTDLARRTANNVKTGLDNANALDEELWQWNNNFTGMMEDFNRDKLYKTMQWFLDRSAGFEEKMCSYLNNPILNNTAELACNINVGFANYLGTLDNNYMQIPASVRWLYFDFRPNPNSKNPFDAVNRTYDMQIKDHQRVYKEQTRAAQAYMVNIANLARTIYGEPVRTQLVDQVKVSTQKMDAEVREFMQAKQDTINMFLNAIPRVLSATICLYIIKALAYKSNSDPAKPVKASDMLAYGSKMAILPTIAFMAYSLAAPSNEYAVGTQQVNRNFLLMAEAACLTTSALAVNTFRLHVHPTIERLVAVLGAGLTAYHFFNLPEFTVTSEVPTCAANLPHVRLADNNEQVNAFLAANMLPRANAFMLNSMPHLAGSAYSAPSSEIFTHCNPTDQANAEQQFKDIIHTFLQVYSGINLLSHVVTAYKGHSYKELTHVNFGLFLARCFLAWQSTWDMQVINYNLDMPQPGALEVLLAALVMSMNVQSTTTALQESENQEAGNQEAGA